MNYSEMSNNELSIELTRKELNRIYPGAKSIEYDDRQNCFWVEKIGFCSHEVFNVKKIEHMWPIIMENGIDIEWPEPFLGGVGQCTKYVEGATDITVEFKDKKEALRAAAICYLEM